MTTWQNAVQSLFLYHKIVTDAVPEKGGIEAIQKLLLGTDMSVRPLRSGASVFGVGIDSALLSFADGRWGAVAVYEGLAYWLTSEGQRGDILTNADMADVKDGVVFHEKEITKDHVLAFYRRHKKQVLQILAGGFLVNIFSLTLPIYSAFVYDKVLGNDIHETLWALAIGLFFVAMIDFAVRALRAMLAERFAISSETDIDHGVFRGLLAAKAQNLPSVGQFLDRYKRILSARDLLSSTYLLSLVDLPFLFLFAFVVFMVSGFLVLVPLALGFLMLLGNLVTSIPVFDYDRQSRLAEEGRYKILTDFLAAHEVIIGSSLRREMANKWRQACASASSLQSMSRYWRNIGMNFANSMSFLSYVLVIVTGAYMIDSHDLTSGGLLAASMLSSRMMGSFASVITVVMRYRDFRVSLKELGSILPQPASGPVANPERQLSGRLSFDNVTCRLKKEANPVLDAINLRIEHGEIVGIAGIPGSGKTTLLRLIAGVVTPESGEVLIDHYPLRALRPEDLAITVGYKPQELCLIEGTIESNVCAGGAPLTAAEREDVLRMSGLGWVFQQGGIDWTTEVGSRGQSLSGGQRQLVALARALRGTRPILLLDEPTNGLDSHLEKHLAQQIESLRGRSTVIVSTHSRQILSVCDRIIVVGDSRILANGPRDKVLAA